MKILLDLPIPSLEPLWISINNGYLDNECPLLDLDDSLHVLSLKPSTGMDANETVMGGDSRRVVVCHVTSESQVARSSLVNGVS